MPYLKKTEDLKLESGRELHVTSVVGASCDSCKQDIELVDPRSEQGVGALEIHLTGGYAMFYDGQSVDLLFCKKCAQALCEQVPAVDTGIDRADAFAD